MRWYLVLLFCCLALRASARPVAPATRPRPPRELIPYRKADQWGYANANRRLVIRPQYDYAERFDHGLARVWKNDKCGYIDPHGRVVVPISFDRVGYHLFETWHGRQSDRAATLRQLAWPGGGGLVVVFNFLPGDTVRVRNQPPPALLKGAAAWLDDQWLAGTGKWGLYDSTGRAVLALDYAYLHLRTDGLLNAGRLLRLDSGYDQTRHTYYQDAPVYEEQLVTRQGRVLLDGQAFSQLLDFHYGQLLVLSSLGSYSDGFQEMTLVDTAQPARPYAARTWHSQIERLGDDGFIGRHAEYNPFGRHRDPFDEDEWNEAPPLPTSNATLLGRNGEPISAQQYVNLWWVASGRALASIITPEKTLRTGLLDTRTGRWVLPPTYEELQQMTGARLFRMCQQKHWGIIDSAGRVLVAPRYEALKWAGGAYSTPVYTVRKKGKWGLIDYQGRELIAPRYDEVSANKSGYELINRRKISRNGDEFVDEWHGEADQYGRLRIPVVYEDLRRSRDEKDRQLPLWEATRAKRLALLDTTGRLLLDLGASQLSNFRRNYADVYTRVTSDSLAGPVALVQLDTTRHRLRVRRLPLSVVAAAPALGELAAEAWRTPTGQRLVRYTRYPARPISPDSNDLAAIRCWLTTADSTMLLPPIYHAIEPQQLYREWDATPIGSFLRVRQGELFGVVTVEGRSVLPVVYPDVLLPYGLSGVFWVRLPTGYAALDAQQRVLRHTHSQTPPRLPAEFSRGYGLLTEYTSPPHQQWVPVGYVDELGQPFFSDKPGRRR